MQRARSANNFSTSPADNLLRACRLSALAKLAESLEHVKTD